MRDPFTYIPPNETTAPKYAAIRDATTAAEHAIGDAFFDHGAGTLDRPALHAKIGAATKLLHDVIEATCPPCADTSAALRCVRLARMAANEALVSVVHDERARQIAIDQLLLARWQACAAVALED